GSRGERRGTTRPWSRSRTLESPPVPPTRREVDPAARTERHALAHEPRTLVAHGLAVAARADGAARTDDARPGDGRSSGERAEDLADEARAAGEAGFVRDLAVGRHASLRDRVDGREDALAASVVVLRGAQRSRPAC